MRSVSFPMDSSNHSSSSDLEDFAVGFSLSEGIVSDIGDIREVGWSSQPEGETELAITLSPKKLHAFLATRRMRNRVGHGGCGICGIDDAASVFELRDRYDGVTPPVSPAAISRAVSAMRAFQPLARQTQATHAAAWASSDGSLQLVREDVGRHNAMDKLVGALLRDQWDVTDGFCVLTSRCSVELVQKAVASGMRTLVCISAPTTMAIASATRARLTLVAKARGEEFTVFAS
jgi:FdhD protein